MPTWYSPPADPVAGADKVPFLELGEALDKLTILPKSSRLRVNEGAGCDSKNLLKTPIREGAADAGPGESHCIEVDRERAYRAGLAMVDPEGPEAPDAP